jgi:endonuclease/exonuclease/phosphatase family metal-dependent hydrolase
MKRSLVVPALIALLATHATADDARFTLMSYNVWKSWSQVDEGFRKGIESIKASGADIVGLQEASPELADKIVTELGWFRALKGAGSTQLISRFSIAESMAIDRLVGARIRLPDTSATEIVVFNCHLDYQFYGPYAAMKSGATVASVLQEENRSERASQMTAMLAFMKSSLDASTKFPVFLTGDFNGPSHLDWTAATAAQHGDVGAIPWPPSTQIAAAGLLDSFRIAHPDPVKVPGFTWSTIHKESEPQDRIDFTYHQGSRVEVKSSRLFTTNVETTVGPWSASENLMPVRKNSWPSDHAAVVTEYFIKH